MARMRVFNTGKFAEKVTALAAYDQTVITSLYQSPVNREAINRGAAFVIKNYFEGYMDSKARQDSKAYHHVYEFNRTGQSDSRLFKASVTSNPAAAVISFNFTPAKNPNKYGYSFPNKAEVMESGKPIRVTPKKDEYLKFTLSDGRFVTSKQSVIAHPGGPDVKGSFESTFREFTSSQGQLVLKKFGYFERIERGLIEKRRVVIPRINSGRVQGMIQQAQMDAKLIAQGVSTYYV